MTSSARSLPPAIAEQMKLMREAYVQKLQEKMDSITQLWDVLHAVEEGTPAWDTTAGELYRIVHSLAGSGATFGLPRVSEQAKEGEANLRTLHETGGWGYVNPAVILKQLEGLQVVIKEETAPAAPFGAPEPEAVTEIEPQKSYFPLSGARCVCLLEQVAGDSEYFIGPLESFGYEVQRFSTPSALREALMQQSMDAIIINARQTPSAVVIAGEPLAPMLSELASLKDVTEPVIWICSRDDLIARLQAVHLCGRAFLNAPVEPETLIETLEHLTQQDETDAYRVLIVDDEPALTKLYGLLLRQRGFEVREVNYPLEIMEPLIDFRPDLILMDVYMTDCNGVELAAAIRQQEAFVSVPLIFLSSEKDLGRQIEAMSRGGDQFLIKPVKPHHLVSVVGVRATRGRLMRRLMERDSLTRLFHHTKFNEHLSIEINRARRLGHGVSLVMLDIDHFKEVNDTYGHAAGDRVLKALTRVLTQRLRQTDVVGRYGGEEFAIVLNGTTGEQAVKVVEELREAFANLTHYVGELKFKATFSAGIATMPCFQDVATLSEAADKALYQAKNAGRNRVVLYEKSE